MHYTLTVALDGNITSEELHTALKAVMDKFDENREVPAHRSTSVYAEFRSIQLAKAIAFATKEGREISDEDALVAEWNGDTQFDTDGWPLTTTNPEGHWDYWSVGGRWAYAWALKDGATPGPLQYESTGWGGTPDVPSDYRGTDSARLCDLNAESITPSYSWIDLDGAWHTKWIGPKNADDTAGYDDPDAWVMSDADRDQAFLKFIADLPGATWLVNIDYHN